MTSNKTKINKALSVLKESVQLPTEAPYTGSSINPLTTQGSLSVISQPGGVASQNSFSVISQPGAQNASRTNTTTGVLPVAQPSRRNARVLRATTKPCNIEDYNPDSLIFEPPVFTSLPGNDPPISFHRVPIYTKNDDGTEGLLVISLGDLFSYGVNENIDKKTGKVSRSMAFPLWHKEGKTEDRENKISRLEQIVERAKTHLIENREDVGQGMLEMSMLRKFGRGKFTPVYYPIDAKGKAITDKTPVMYAKLIEFPEKKDKKGKLIPASVGTYFSIVKGADSNRESRSPIQDALDQYSQGSPSVSIEETTFDALIGKMCNSLPLFHITSIFVGSFITLQLKLYEVVVQIFEVRPKTSFLYKRNVGRENESRVKNLLITPGGTAEEVMEEKKDEVDEVEIYDR